MLIAGVEAPGPKPRHERAHAAEWWAPQRTIQVATKFVLHETAGSSNPVPSMRSAKSSVQLIVHPDGLIRQHADLLSLCWHVRAPSDHSIGVEVINPCHPSLMPRASSPWRHVIDAPWAWAPKGQRGQYVVPTIEQAEACTGLVAWLCSDVHERIAIPWAWAGRDGDRFLLSPVANHSPGGIYAHQHIGGHADGAWLALYTWMRLVVCMAPAEAYAEAMRRCTGVRAAYVGDLVERLIVKGQA